MDAFARDMLGNEVADHIRAIRPDIPVLYMSGYAQPVLAENGTLPDGVTIVEKPFTSRELLDKVCAFPAPTRQRPDTDTAQPLSVSNPRHKPRERSRYTATSTTQVSAER